MAEDVEGSEPWGKPGLNTAYRSLKHAERLHELHADILALRQQALDKDGKICNAQLFAKSIRLRNQLLKDELDMVEGTHSADAATHFHDAILEDVRKVSPEVAKAIALALYNKSKGGDHEGKEPA